jgi:hypothetical protein
MYFVGKNTEICTERKGRKDAGHPKADNLQVPVAHQQKEKSIQRADPPGMAWTHARV